MLDSASIIGSVFPRDPSARLALPREGRSYPRRLASVLLIVVANLDAPDFCDLLLRKAARRSEKHLARCDRVRDR